MIIVCIHGKYYVYIHIWFYYVLLTHIVQDELKSWYDDIKVVFAEVAKLGAFSVYLTKYAF